MFSEQEIDYLNAQRLARIATVSSQQQPDVAPVGFDFDGEYIYVGGRNNTVTLKYKNVHAGNAQVALVIDDLKSVNPWLPRGIKIHGTADIVQREGYAGRGPYLRIRPDTYWSWGIAEHTFQGAQPT
jgi:pyridoxamine 5'-phosphate oxidase family protein